MACTIRIAVDTAKFGQPEVTLGLVPGGGGTQRLPRLVGKGRALQLILSGDMISAQEAYRIGLVNEIVPAADLITRAEAILKKIAANAPIAVKFALEATNKGMDDEPRRGLAARGVLLRPLRRDRGQEGGHEPPSLRSARRGSAGGEEKPRAYHSGETYAKRQYLLRAEGRGLREFHRGPPAPLRHCPRLRRRRHQSRVARRATSGG